MIADIFIEIYIKINNFKQDYQLINIFRAI